MSGATGTLFDIPKTLARRVDPESSKIAAEKVIQENILSGHELIIIDTLKHSGEAMTTHEISKHTLPHITNEQVHKRMKGLEVKGKIKRGIIRDCSLTGNKMIEWSIL
jgi:hypothetical protein